MRADSVLASQPKAHRPWCVGPTWAALVIAMAAPLNAGPVPEPVTLRNDGAEPITCHAEIAHWFAADLGAAAPGADVVIDLWRNPATGEVTTRNAKAELLPVERAWCGVAGRAYQTRWQIPLTRATGAAPGAGTRFACTVQEGRLACR